MCSTPGLQNPTGYFITVCMKKMPTEWSVLFRITLKLWTPEPVEPDTVLSVTIVIAFLWSMPEEHVFHTHTHLNCYFRIIHPTQPLAKTSMHSITLHQRMEHT